MTLPIDLDCESAIQPKEISIIENKHKDDERSITEKPSKEVGNNEDEINTHSLNFIDCPTIDL